MPHPDDEAEDEDDDDRRSGISGISGLSEKSSVQYMHVPTPKSYYQIGNVTATYKIKPERLDLKIPLQLDLNLQGDHSGCVKPPVDT